MICGQFVDPLGINLYLFKLLPILHGRRSQIAILFFPVMGIEPEALYHVIMSQEKST